jgi:Ulp1 family protease
VNLKGVHWITTVVHSGRIEVYDSMKYSGVPAILQSFFQKYYGKECKVEVGGFPKQDNLVDCGVFTLCGIEDLIHNREWTFSQADMLAKRLTLARGIMAKR